MEVYRVESEDLVRIPKTELGSEQALEEHLVKANGATIGGVELMYLGRQEDVGEGGIFDILAVDERGDLVIVELKRDQAPRDVVTQALEYASGLRNSDYNDLQDRYHSFLQQANNTEYSADDPPALTEAHAAYFGLGETELAPRDFNQDQRLLLVGDDFRDVTLSMADFLREHEIDVICVEYASFGSESGNELLTTEAVRRALSEEPSGEGDEEMTAGSRLQKSFWAGLQREISSRDTPLTARKPQPNTSLNYYTQFTQDVVIQFAFKIRDGELDCRFIVRDNAELYETLRADRESIEQEITNAVGESVSWTSPDESRASRERGIIQMTREIDPEDESKWPAYHEWLIEGGEALKTVMDSRLG